MAEGEPTILERTLTLLSQEFGEPVCRGDCCWWTLSRERRKPVRVSVFIDSDPDRAQGWISDLQEPDATTERFTIFSESDVQPLIAHIRRLLARHSEPAEVSTSDAPRQPTAGR